MVKCTRVSYFLKLILTRINVAEDTKIIVARLVTMSLAIRTYTDMDGNRLTETVAVLDLKHTSRNEVLEMRDARRGLCHKKVVELLGWAQLSK